MTTAEKCTVIKYRSTLICALNVVSQIRELKSHSAYTIPRISIDDCREAHCDKKNIAAC